MKRVIGLIDMDCFYAQVEQRDQPDLWGKPVIVVQHSRQGAQGGILAVSYEARPFGVKRGMTVPDAKVLCPELNICNVPIGEYADKADIQKYRDASAEVFEVLNNYDSNIVVEKASVDEAFLDLSIYIEKIIESGKYAENFDIPEALEALPTSHIADGCDKKETDLERIERMDTFLEDCRYDESQLRLMIAAQTIEDIRAKVREKTQFFCSAGVGNNKMMAKLVCARHKPRQQTIIPLKYVKDILKTTPINDVRGFGGKMGMRIRDELGIQKMGEILEIDYVRLIEVFPDQHEWLRSVAEGYDTEPVRPRSESSSIAVSKNFPGRSAIDTSKEMKQWIEGLTKELSKRLITDQIQNKRTAENLVYSLLTEDGKPQKTIKISSYHPDILIDQLWKAIKTLNKASNEVFWHPKVFNIYLGASRFSPGIPAQSRAITEWLNAKPARIYENVEEDAEEILVVDEIPASKPSTSKSTNDTIIILDDDEEEEKEAENQNDDCIHIDGRKFTRYQFKMLPEFVRKQYEHRLALESARKLKLANNAKNTVKRKRQGSEPSAKKPKSLKSFFNRK